MVNERLDEVAGSDVPLALLPLGTAYMLATEIALALELGALQLVMPG